MGNAILIFLCLLLIGIIICGTYYGCKSAAEYYDEITQAQQPSSSQMMNENAENPFEGLTEEQRHALLGGLGNKPGCSLNDVPQLNQLQNMVYNDTYTNGYIFDLYGYTAGNRGRINNIL